MSAGIDPGALAVTVDALRRGAVKGTRLPLARLAAGETVRIGLLDFRGLWTGESAADLERIKVQLPSVSWVRLGGPGAPWTREVRT